MDHSDIPSAKIDNNVKIRVSREKLARAIKELNSPGSAANLKEKGRIKGVCGHILNQLCHTYHSSPSTRQYWHEAFRKIATRHEWDTFLRALRVASQTHTFCGSNVLLRNTFFAILTHPAYRDPNTLRLFLYAVAPCRNEKDIEYCIQAIIKSFDAVDYIDRRKTSKKRNNVAVESDELLE